jgi:uncharacterized protein YjdB
MKLFFLFIQVVLVLARPNIVCAVPCDSNPDIWCNQLGTGNYGCQLGSFSSTGNNTVAYSNGGFAGGDCGNYQCVDYIKRFYRDQFGIIVGSIGVAQNIFNMAAQFGLYAHPNGSAVLPRPGDILVFGSSNGIGHVSIITSVSASNVSFIEQNWSSSSCTGNLSLSTIEGSYSVATRGAYYVIGWVSRFSDNFTSDNIVTHHAVKFNDSPVCYLYSNQQLWQILDEETYALLGYNIGNGNCTTPDWNFLITLPSTERNKYLNIIRQETVVSYGVFAKVVDKIGPNTCSQRDRSRSPSTVYFFDLNHFRPIMNENVYFELVSEIKQQCIGDWDDVVEITQDLFNKHGEGYPIYSTDDVFLYTSGMTGRYKALIETCTTVNCSIASPSNLTATPSSSTSALLSFDPPGLAESYNVLLYQDGIPVFQTPCNGCNQINKQGLSPDTTYCFEIATVLHDEVSVKSNTACTATLSTIPSTVVISGPDTVTIGETIQLTAAASGGSDSSYTWTTSNAGKATVDSNGVVTGVSSGSAVIGATGDDTGASGTKEITITDSPPFTYKISGMVKENNNPLSGVTVTLSGASSMIVTTASEGMYYFTHLDNGNYTITPAKEMYEFIPKEITVSINGADVLGQNFAAVFGPASVHGMLHEGSQDGPPLSGATVSCGEVSGTTSADGTYILSEISPGSHALSFIKIGYQSFSKTLDISAGEDLDAGDDYLLVSKGQIVIQPGPDEGEDVWITSIYDYDDDYGVDNEKLWIGGWGDQYWSLLRFDVSQLPAGVTSAKIQLFCYDDGDGYPNVSMHLDRVTEPWDEETGWHTQPSFEFEGNLSKPVDGFWSEIDITEMYKNWKTGVYPNYGIQLRPTRNSMERNAFYSSDYIDDPSLRPKLVLDAPGIMPTVTITSRDAIASEPGRNIGKFEVTRSAEDLTRGLIVKYLIRGTAANGEDYQELLGWVKIRPGKTSAIIRVVPIDDEISEKAETVRLVLKKSHKYIVGSARSAVVKIMNKR